jgi:hypothetical protein
LKYRSSEVHDTRSKGDLLASTGATRERGTTPAQCSGVTDDSVRQRRLLDAQVERWTAEAKKLAEAGKDGEALELYRRAADELPGAPWLQHRTAELARKLRQPDVAISYFRRAATAFQIADFVKRAVAPMRTAWSLAVDNLPGTSKVLVELALELMQLQRRLGFAADATVTLERTNLALRTRGFSEIPSQLLDAMEREPVSGRSSRSEASGPPSSLPPSSRRLGSSSSAPPSSQVGPRGSGSPPNDGSPSSRSRALARLLGRR